MQPLQPLQPLQTLPADVLRLLLADPGVFYSLTKTNRFYHQYANDPLVLRAVCDADISLPEIKRVLSNPIIRSNTRIEFFNPPSQPNQYANPALSDLQGNYKAIGGSGWTEFETYRPLNVILNDIYVSRKLTVPGLLLIYRTYQNRTICREKYPNYAIIKTLEYYDRIIQQWKQEFQRTPTTYHATLRKDFNSYLVNFAVYGALSIDQSDLLTNDPDLMFLPGLTVDELVGRLFLAAQKIREMIPGALQRLDN